MNDIIAFTNGQLPANVAELKPFIAVGTAAVQAAKRILQDKSMAPEARAAMLARAQEQADVLIDAELALARWEAEQPKPTRGAPEGSHNNPQGRRTKELIEQNVQLVHQPDRADYLREQRERETRAELLANPEAVQKARELARENSDLVTKSLVKAVIRQDRKAEQLSTAKNSIIEQTRQDASGTPPIVRLMDCVEFIAHCKPYDLLLTDPPYSTNIEDIKNFVDYWLYSALERVKPTGSAYIFIGAYPKELQAYLNAEIPTNVHLEQILIWTYKNTGGKIPNEHYKQNYQACLYYRGSEAGTLDNKDNEFWAVTEINAPDGRVGDRFHVWQKPMSLAEMYVRHSTKKGDLVVDPFCCTGTFLLAAAKLGRVAAGADNNEENLKIALERGCLRA